MLLTCCKIIMFIWNAVFVSFWKLNCHKLLSIVLSEWKLNNVHGMTVAALINSSNIQKIRRAKLCSMPFVMLIKYTLTTPVLLYASPIALQSTILFQFDSTVVNQYTNTSSARIDMIISAILDSKMRPSIYKCFTLLNYTSSPILSLSRFTTAYISMRARYKLDMFFWK